MNTTKKEKKIGKIMINNLRRELLGVASTKQGPELFVEAVKAIQETSNSSMCSLWRINNNSTHEPREYKSASLVARELENGLKYPSKNNEEDYVHALDDSLIQCVLSQLQDTSLLYYLCNITNCTKFGVKSCQKIKSKETLEQLNLRYFFSIPVPEPNNPKTTALVILAFKHKPTTASKTNEIELFSKIIRDVVLSCFYRNISYKKHQIMQQLVNNYHVRGTKKNWRIFSIRF